MTRRATRRRSAVLAAALLLGALAGVTRLFVVPRSDPARASDAVVVLGPALYGGRLARAEAVLAAHPGAVLLVSRDDPRQCLRRPSGARSVACFRPTPFSTRGEARYVAALARARRWRSVLVVTSADQVFRARLRFRRCWRGSLAVVAVPTPRWQLPRSIAYESAATLKAELWQRNC